MSLHWQNGKHFFKGQFQGTWCAESTFLFLIFIYRKQMAAWRVLDRNGMASNNSIMVGSLHFQWCQWQALLCDLRAMTLWTGWRKAGNGRICSGHLATSSPEFSSLAVAAESSRKMNILCGFLYNPYPHCSLTMRHCCPGKPWKKLAEQKNLLLQEMALNMFKYEEHLRSLG